MFKSIGQALTSLYTTVMPGAWLRMKPAYQWAAGIAVVVVLWVASGQLMGHAKTVDPDSVKPVSSIPQVRVVALSATARDATVTIRGRTQAKQEVDVRAEVEGVVQAIHFDKGDHVRKGDVLCEIKLNDRGAKVQQAQALAAQTQKELQIARELFTQGFRSKTQLAQSEAAAAAARAALATMQVAAGNTRVRAPFAGFVDNRYVNVGDYMRPGDKCEMVIAPEPFLATGTVSEQDVGGISLGDPATVTLVTGEIVQGKVSFVADRADDVTRAFRIEVQLPNSDGKLRDGVSAEINIAIKKVKAHHISPGILVLSDKGTVGVRVVNGGVVAFLPVRVLSEDATGAWVTGLPGTVNVITVGQEFVNDGQHVQPVFDRSGKSS
ncbi:MAG: efflux RND transporter periplasmic adaptor subunit [Alphaproteobacteria bacterium]|nr:efflux RND transporter periplasmic adaptor subunit [Alphaproteobacteria bacterium]MBV9903205.1 efflux RND transporter periplasmic adaptor subunit [Alphaproteobacteria bacterium]